MESQVTFKPMLADPPDHDKHPLRFPFLASPKLDGIRCIITPDGARTRSLKPLPNKALGALLSELPAGLDGELVAGDAKSSGAMQATSSAVMGRERGLGGLTFYVFDMLDCFSNPAAPYRLRMLEARRTVERAKFGSVRFLEHTSIESFAELVDFEAHCIAAGYEGAMIRDPRAPYKFGRSTAKEQGLLKLKRFEDAEGEIVDAFELETNTNEQTRDERGYAKRSSAKAGKVGAATLGGYVVKLEGWKAATLRVGNGWTADQRAALWEAWQVDPDAVRRGPLLKYKFQREGSKDAPRLPVAIGFRDRRDL